MQQLPKYMPCPCRVHHINNTNLGAIQALFNVMSFPRLGANDLPSSTPPSYAVAAQRVIRVPINCVCYNGSGTSSGGPTYTVQPGDGLFHIAAEVFSQLVLFPEIADANNISDPNLIEKVVHYSHVVRPNSTLAEIAREFGADEQTLGRINGITAQNELLAEQPIDVPLRDPTHWTLLYLLLMAHTSSPPTIASDAPVKLLTTTGRYTVNLPGLIDHPGGKDAHRCNAKAPKVYPSAMSPCRDAVDQHVPMPAITTRPSSLPWFGTRFQLVRAIMSRESV
ncbi:Lysm domain GPI-anchored protein 2 precursor [Hibiscus syriacus]|uniref:Lysm domain GPI-anchored protein 2 n=1 Tax=Hibiscus syriacus TaxID=106335 RepID=A0A6A3CAN7_HIBSY|nr:Lysm domain GPI-anchored protein 2 precursor [Hibiscus syriacus]